MFDSLRRWREQRVLRSSAIPDELWREALEALPFLAIYRDDELARLRDKVVLFLDAKHIFGAHALTVTPLMRVIIALQACALVLNLDLALYDGFETIVLYPAEFVPNWEYEDEFGVVHRYDDPLAGEAMHGGPVVLSWPDVEASTDWESSGMNLVVHEFAHKIDMRNGTANGCPPLPSDIPHAKWMKVMRYAYESFSRRIERGEDTEIDPYASESPGEFFAVLSEVFFADPVLLKHEYPAVYQQFAQFYKQDPASRVELLLGE
ncbi:MAG TPA: M90 family metallopeptidase [Casimicrobiaceae bacterium]|nr:M90 family metallopeptidase [Casimicrobiaceae bacterium]